MNKPFDKGCVKLFYQLIRLVMLRYFRLTFLFLMMSLSAFSQLNTDKVLRFGRNALYFEDYVLSIQYFNEVIKVKPYLAEPYFYRSIAKINLDDYQGALDDATQCLKINPFLVNAYQVRDRKSVV